MTRQSKRQLNNHGRKGDGRVRLIAGHWRGRRLPIVEAPGLRPTGNRLRETLFNWLQLSVAGAQCLDLFAGSGALGFEAASRGAASVTLVESNRVAANNLAEQMQLLGAGQQVQLEHMNAVSFLENSAVRFDLVFVDPPFDDHCQLEILQQLMGGHLAEQSLVYIEAPSKPILADWPAHCQVYRQQQFGDVMAYLLQIGATLKA
ncbi:MAG: 16S rRNA (guanine(966)-N(2))-methyltransferase RsmD [Granulosicoccus sp.]